MKQFRVLKNDHKQIMKQRKVELQAIEIGDTESLSNINNLNEKLENILNEIYKQCFDFW